MPYSVPADLFDTSHYAATAWRKLVRSCQLGGRYYLFDVPRYWWHRRRLQLPGCDLAVLGNPLREFARRPYIDWPLPPQLDMALSRCYEAGVRFTMPEVRLLALVGCWWSCRDVPGDVIECGAYRGATSLLLAVLAELHGLDQRVLMLDTFRGMPEPTRFDAARHAGQFDPSAGQVAVIQRQARQLGVDRRTEIWQGLFADTFAAWAGRDLQLAFVHIDANLYQGTLDACQYCLSHTAAGGAVVFDDYNGLCDLGARLAIDQALAARGQRPEPLAHCSAWIRIPPTPR